MNNNIAKISNRWIMSISMICGFWATQVSASECGILQLQSNKSSAVTIQDNTCSDKGFISLGTTINLPARGRLWLKSNTTTDDGKPFQMICQNRGRQALDLSFSASQSPWLNTKKLDHCSQWSQNKLNCQGSQGGKRGLYCALSYMKPASERLARVQRTTSLKMRKLAVTEPKSNNRMSKRIVQAIIPELDLCKSVNQISNTVDMNWQVSPGGVAKSINIRLAGKKLSHGAMKKCLDSTLAAFPYPLSFKTIDLEVKF